MNLDAFIAAVAPAAANILAKLRALLAAEPALAGVLQPLIDGLDAPLDATALLKALAVIEPEGAQFLKDFKLVPRSNPSDLVG
jgi:hypothetical protein